MPSTLKSGRYVVEGTLGSGSQGMTLDGVDTTTGMRVAIKSFTVRGAESWKDVELAEREARVLSAIDHPRLPRYVDHFEENGALFLVMHRIEGESLSSLRKRGGALARAEIVRLLAEVGEALDYLHGRAPPIIHRDIKPGNVIRRPDGGFSLVDFGSVRDSLKPEGGSTVVGTFGYMAPEQFQGRALPQSDVYALGATALTLLANREPEALPHRGLAIDVRAALSHDPSFASVLERMLEPDPDRRATRVAPLVADLGPTPGARTSDPETPSVGPGPHRSTRQPNPFIIILLILGLVVARLSTGVMFRVFLPFVLVVLSLVFGGRLRRAASRVRRVGERGDQGIQRAMDFIRGRPRDRWRPPRRGAKFRVDDPDPDEPLNPSPMPSRSRRHRHR
ncbi:MAG TPA: serine/threonine-protein kinase [Polyangiaceae bacterium]